MPCPTGDGQPHGHRRPAPWLGAIVALLALAGMLAPAVSSWRNERAAWAGLATRIAQIQPARADARIEACHTWLAQKPLVLMVLGQSNAANHGARQPGQPPVRVVHKGRCLWAVDPLPGGTGSGGSIWSRLPARLAERLPPPWRDRPVVLAVLAVDAAPLDAWLRDDRPLRGLLAQTVRDLLTTGLVPDLVLWQQGEADAREHSSQAQVSERLTAFARQLAAAGIHAPWMLATSTVCRSAPDTAVRAAVLQLSQPTGRFVPGPDTDALATDVMRHDGCHFSAPGLDAAAGLWANALAAYFAGRQMSSALPPRPPTK